MDRRLVVRGSRDRRDAPRVPPRARLLIVSWKYANVSGTRRFTCQKRNTHNFLFFYFFFSPSIVVPSHPSCRSWNRRIHRQSWEPPRSTTPTDTPETASAPRTSPQVREERVRINPINIPAKKLFSSPFFFSRFVLAFFLFFFF